MVKMSTLNHVFLIVMIRCIDKRYLSATGVILVHLLLIWNLIHVYGELILIHFHGIAVDTQETVKAGGPHV